MSSKMENDRDATTPTFQSAEAEYVQKCAPPGAAERTSRAARTQAANPIREGLYSARRRAEEHLRIRARSVGALCAQHRPVPARRPRQGAAAKNRRQDTLRNSHAIELRPGSILDSRAERSQWMARLMPRPGIADALFPTYACHAFTGTCRIRACREIPDFHRAALQARFHSESLTCLSS